VRRLALLLLLLSLAGPQAASASEAAPTLAELEREVICPTCHQILALSDAPIADRMRAFIRARIAAGDTKSEIKAKLVAEFGEGVLAAPSKRGFNLLAWGLPLAGGLVALVTLGLLARRWSRTREPAPGGSSARAGGPLDPELERRLDDELARFEA
jgi:cytochrome c-type biogenesis protein CcmH